MMSHQSRITAIASVAALALPLMACGGDDTDAEYCELVEDFNEKYAGLGDDDYLSDADLMSDMNDALRAVADSAPDDIKDDWSTTADAFDQYVDLAAELRPENPDDVAADEMAELSDQLDDSMDQLAAGFDDFDGIGERIQAHMRDECDITLS